MLDLHLEVRWPRPMEVRRLAPPCTRGVGRVVARATSTARRREVMGRIMVSDWIYY